MLKLSKPKILATLLVKNEEHIIAQTIEHHIEQGVTDFIVTDNNSVDQTRDIVASYKEVREIIDSDNNAFDQRILVTRMARLACDFNPDWIIHIDADEFWCNLSLLSKEKHNYLRTSSFFNHLPIDVNTPAEFDFNNFPYYAKNNKEREGDLVGIHRFKVLHRPDPEVIIGNGNHRAHFIGTEKEVDYIHIHHYPVLHYDHFERKTITGGRALKGIPEKPRPDTFCLHWRLWYEEYLQGQLPHVYEEIVTKAKSFYQEAESLGTLGVWPL